MSSVIIAGDTSGTVTLQAPSAAGSTVINLPTVTGGSFIVSDASGNVGIGTSSPAAKLQVAAGNILLSNAYYLSGRNAANTLSLNLIGRNTSDQVSIDPDGYGTTLGGNVGIGTSSPATKLDVGGQVRATSNSDPYALILRYNASTAGFIVGSPSADALSFCNSGGTERARIDSSGNLLVNNTSGSVSGPGTGQAVVACSTSGKFALAITNTNASGAYGLGINSQTGENIYFYYQGTYKGLVSTSASGTTYGTASDYRLKENVQPMLGALEKVSQLKPCTYVWKENGSFGQGFIAHELAEVCQQAVVGEKDAIDENGNPKYQNIDTSFLVATLTAAIQELKAELDAAKADIATLKGQA